MQLTDPHFYQGMSDQPDCCGRCGARLDHVETVTLDGELVDVCQCLGCHRIVGVVDMGEVPQPEGG